MGIRAPKGPKQPEVGTDSLSYYFGAPSAMASTMPSEEEALRLMALKNQMPQQVSPEVIDQATIDKAKQIFGGFGVSGPSKEELEIRKLLEKQMVEGIAKQRENEAMQKEMLQKALEQSVQPDLSAAWGLVKAAGGDVSAAALSPKNLNPDIQALQQSLQKTSGAITDDEINLLKTKLQAAQGDSERRKGNQYLNTMEMKAFNEAQKQMTKPVQDFLTKAAPYNSVKEAISTGQTSKINRALSQYARIMGQTGVLTDQDVILQMPPTAYGALSRAYTWVTGNPEKELPEEIVKDLIESLDSGFEGIKKATEMKVNLAKDTLETGPYGQYKWLPTLTERALSPMKSIRAEKATAAPSGLNVDKDALQAEMKRRGLVK